MEQTFWTLVPPILAIVMVLTTRRVLISLGVGIIAAAFFIANFNIIGAVKYIWEAFKGVFMEDGGVNTWNIYILLFLILLGILTSFVSMMGGTRAFGDWMIKRVKTRIGAQLMTMVLGIIIFVDDYFNSLTVGPISKPITDKHRISRAKLSYIVDSTAAPISVIAPVSSWGAYIIGIIGSVLVTHNITDYTEFEAFIKMIPMNFYVWAALGVVIIIAISKVDFGPMKKHEQHALGTGEVKKYSEKDSKKLATDLPVSRLGKIGDLLLPIGILFVGTIIAIYVNGLIKVEGEKTLINIFGAADVSVSLLIGGLLGVLMSFFLFTRHKAGGELTSKHFFAGFIEGTKLMIGAIFILIFAWAIASLIEILGTGEYLASLVKMANFNLAFLPVIVFIMAGFIAFSTGTSWGSFAILLPIAGQIAASTEVELLLPVLAAVLAGAVFGDHCSPISDTTILSATGANCGLMDHVTTQLPYALVAALITSIGYISLGLTGNVWVGLVSIIISLFIFYMMMHRIGKKTMSYEGEKLS